MDLSRDDALADVLAALDRGGWVSLVGAPGVGKSTLASRVVATLRARDVTVAQVTCERPLSRLELLLDVATALGVAVRTVEERQVFEHLVSRLERTPTLLALDGPGVASREVHQTAHELLIASPHARVLACTWEPLGHSLETVVVLPPLDPDAARALVVDRLARLLPHGRRPASETELDAMVHRADGLPLALELIAAQFALVGPVALDAPLVGHALERSIAAALSSLSPELRLALGALSLFEGPFSPAAALAVIGSPRGIEWLTTLRATALLHQQPLDDSLRLLDTIRHAVRTQTPADVLGRAEARRCDFFARPSMPRADDSHTFASLAQKKTELLAAWRWARAQGPERNGDVLELARTLDPILVTQGPGTTHLEVLEGSSERCRGDGPVELDVLLAYGRLLALRGRHRRALELFLRVREGATRTGDVGRLAWACSLAAYSARPLGALEEGRRLAQEALSLAREGRDLRVTAMSEVSLGSILRTEHDLQAALTCFRRAAVAARLAEAPRQLGIAWGNVGHVLLALDDLDGAATALADARREFERVGDQFHLARLAVDEVALAARRDAPDAEARYVLALDALRLTGAFDGELLLREEGVRLALARGDRALALERLEAWELACSMGDDVAAGTRAARLGAKLRGGPTARVLRLSRDGRVVKLGDETLDFSRRGPLRRVLVALVEARLASRVLSAFDLQEAGWPGERMFPESASARVYAAVKRLRELGLAPLLLTRDEGYLLAPEADVAWLESRG